VIGKLNTRFRNGTRKMPPPRPKQRTETAGDDTGNENNERQGRSDGRHTEV
jgi:hypothetical protein